MSRSETGGSFLFTNDIEEAAQGNPGPPGSKRKALNLAPNAVSGRVRTAGAAARSFNTYVPPAGLASLGCGKAQERTQARPPED